MAAQQTSEGQHPGAHLLHGGPPTSETECPRHGVAMPPIPPGYPSGYCHYCGGKVTPWVPPEKATGEFAPRGPYTPGAYVDGVLRDGSGSITGIMWGELRGSNSHLAGWKDRAIGPGHPLSMGQDPRNFIPCAAAARPGPGPVPVLLPSSLSTRGDPGAQPPPRLHRPPRAAPGHDNGEERVDDEEEDEAADGRG